MSLNTPNGTQPAAGWYADPQDAAQLRWWDGTQWSAHTAPVPQPVAPAPASAAEPPAVPRYGEYVPQAYAAQPYAAVPPAAQQSAPQRPAAQQSADQPPVAQQAAAQPPVVQQAAAQPWVVQSYSEQPYGVSPGQAGVAPGTPTESWQIWGVVLLPLVSLLFLFTWDIESYLRASMENPALAESLLLDPGYVLVTLGSWALAAAMIVLAVLDWRWLGQQGYPRRFHWAWAILSSLLYVIGRAVVVKRQAGRGLAPMWAGIAVTVITSVVAIAWSVQLVNSIISTVMLTPGIAS